MSSSEVQLSTVGSLYDLSELCPWGFCGLYETVVMRARCLKSALCSTECSKREESKSSVISRSNIRVFQETVSTDKTCLISQTAWLKPADMWCRIHASALPSPPWHTSAGALQLVFQCWTWTCRCNAGTCSSCSWSSPHCTDFCGFYPDALLIR